MMINYIKQIGERKHFFKEFTKESPVVELPANFGVVTVYLLDPHILTFTLDTQTRVITEDAIWIAIQPTFGRCFVINFPVSFLKISHKNDKIYTLNILCE